MKLPWVSRKKYEQSLQFSAEDIEATNKVYQENINLRAEVTRLTAMLENATASRLIADALDRQSQAIDRRTEADSAAMNNVFGAVKNLAHSLGAQATAQDKAANVQIEWLELSKGKR